MSAEQSSSLQKKGHVHITGICGVATSAIGIAFHKKGWKVTGSDKGFFPPVSTALEEVGIPFYAGWHPEKMIESGVPDFVIAGTASGTQNPETEYARTHNIPIKSDAEVRGEFFAKKNSIVTVSTWGKTSTTALLAHILTEAEYDPSYVIGGLSLSTDAARLGDSDWSVIEGDEYKSSPWDNRPKFYHARATHILMPAVSWDHADLYPTEASYFKVFEDLMHTLPAHGLVVGCADHPGVLQTIKHAKCPVILYAKNKGETYEGTPGEVEPAYTYDDVEHSRNGLSLVVSHGETDWKITCPMLGLFQAENIAGCFAIAHQIGVPADAIISAIASFKGLKRRLEKRYEGATASIQSPDVTVIDDIAHSPEKAAAVLSSLRDIYDHELIAIFEPNIGGRRPESAHKYDNAFKDASVVIIPRLTKLKIGSDEKERPFEGADLATVIAKTHPTTIHIDDDDALVTFIKNYIDEHPTSVIAFLGSHGFRGMIEAAVEKIKTRN